MLLRSITALLLPVVLAACAGPSYYLQAAAGQYDLMRQREPIDELLASDLTDPELAARLELARDIQAFGTEQLGLPDEGGYRQYAETGREAATWIVAAAPEFSFEPKTWCFLFAGCVPYRGYFERSDAERFAGKLRDKGYDVIVAPASAYSTLGWFDDPLLDTMFSHGEVQFAGTLFHEMAHLALYVKNDAAFNESFARFVEETGLRLWLEFQGDSDRYLEWKMNREQTREIDVLFASRRQELDVLYASDITDHEKRERKQLALDSLCAEMEQRFPAYRGAACRLNNASFSLRQAYQGGSCAFESLYREANGDMRRFIELATYQSGLPPENRDTWLSQPCSPVAPEVNL